MIELKTETLIKIANDISELYKKEKSIVSYGANIVDELHAGENAHSRILRMLLQYKGGGKYPIYTSFLDMLSYHCQAMPHITISSPLFSNEEGRIDLLVKEWNSDYPYAIIIENKICDAGDQYHQIQRYIEFLIDEFKKHIFVVYLTKDGEKVVSDDSLTKKAKEYLDVSEESQGRYIPIDYKNHILPWLEHSVLPNLKVKESILISSVQLYIDYLKGMFGMRQKEQEITNKIYSIMKTELNIDSLQESIELYRKVSLLNENATSLLLEYARTTLEKKLFQPLLNTFPDSNIKGTDVQVSRFCFVMTIPKWKKCWISLTWDGDGQYYGICHIDFKTNAIDAETRKQLGEVMPDGKSTDWWPWWKLLRKNIDTADSLNIWEDVQNGIVYNFFKDWITDVVGRTKDLDL